MLPLLLRVLFTVAFSHGLRLSQRRTRFPLRAAVVNYLLATLAGAAWMAAAGWRLHLPTFLLGVAAGATYVSSLLLVMPSMRKSGVSVTGAVMQLALMVPVGVAIVRFGEMPNALQTAGIVLTMIALPVLSATTAVTETTPKRGISALTLILFASSGLSQTLMKEFSAVSLPTDLPLFTTSLFITAMIGTHLWTVFVPQPETPATEGERFLGEWPVGAALGVVNVLQLVCLVLALERIPAVIVFPVSASLGIIVNAFASMLFWKERPPTAGWIGIGLAVGAVVLLNLK